MEGIKQDKQQGRLHPITIAIRDIADIFDRMGFGVAYGPELEDDFHVFTGLNIPPNHPARSMQDTFWVKDSQEHLLRTQVTAVSIRELEKLAKEGGTHLRCISLGKVFRNESTDATHEAQFYQVMALRSDQLVRLRLRI
jgi:phenylalanyl-tRNA synthetase alpha chain